MTSPYVRPDQAALTELERVLRSLTDELAGWRRRCLKAEGELQGLKAKDGMVPGDDLLRLRSRVLDLERYNLDLESRVERARELVGKLQQRLAFIEEQQEAELPR
ncbi:MAG: hypothetical protein SFU57_00525 [Gemmatimonadales bacterium]|nr:hypothetical protein [Gemmatimonadales bacterium]MDZ4258708.1 hypothetical protein [Gemmatimonadales bacterium]MDZ4390132.1 hypothetical protein [Gemmatimonadales bacterium]